MLQLSPVMSSLPSLYQVLWHYFSTQGQKGRVRALQCWACGQRLGWDCALLGHRANVSSDHQWDIFVPGHPSGVFLKAWPKCHESLTAAAQVAALPVPHFGQAKISPSEPSASSPWNTNCFPLPWRSHSLTSLHPHLQLTPKCTGSIWDKASSRRST